MKNKFLIQVRKFRLYGILRLAFLVFTLTITQLSLNAQTTDLKKNIKMNNVTVQDLVNKLGVDFKYSFFIVDEQVGKITVSVDIKNATITQILDLAFKEKEIRYTINESSITITAKQKRQNTNISKKITGLVTDEKGDPIIGATVKVSGTTVGTITDVDGKFSVDLRESDKLSITYIGYLSQEVTVKKQNQITVRLNEDNKLLDEIVVVGYGTQRKSDVTGSVVTVKGEELSRSKSANISNTLAGRLPGIVSKQTSGEPGKDGAAISIRGFGSPLVIVDGVEQDFNKIDPEAIESFTVLKDAAAAIYGARAGNGVILITTKRGGNSKPEITANSTFTFQGLTAFPKAVNSGQYAELVNQNAVYNGLTPIYSNEAVAKFYDGSDPINYPNTNWWNLVNRDWSPQQKYDVSVRGGNDQIEYYTFISALDQGGMYKSGDNVYKKYNVRSNIDATITKELKIKTDLSYINSDQKSPVRNVSAIWQDFYGLLPTFPGILPDPTKIAYGGSTPQSPIASTTFDIGGYNRNENTQINAKVSLSYEVPFINGLTLECMGSYYQNRNDYKTFSKQYTLYSYDPTTDTYFNQGSTSPTTLDQGYTVNSNFTTQLSARYNKTFSKVHTVSALFLYERIDMNGHDLSAHGENFLTSTIDYMYAAGSVGQLVGGAATEDGRESYVGRLNYSYLGKYLFQTTLRYDGSPRFYGANQWGLFPSVSAGWRISEESFLKDNLNWLTNLKLRTSYSQLGYDATGKFQYLTGYKINTANILTYATSGYTIGGVGLNGIYSTGLSNPNITWENMTIYNIGLDINILNSLFYSEIDVFYRQRTGILASRALSLPNTFGASLPQENINAQNNRGVELLVGHNGNIGKFKYNVSGNVSWARAQWDYFDEPNYSDPDDIRLKKKTGNWVNEVVTYKSDKIFTSQEEIDNLGFDQDTKGNTTLRPGDIKYVDINGDKKLDYRDQIKISMSDTPELMFGLNLSGSFAGFDFSMLWQGAGRSMTRISPSLYTNVTSTTPYESVYLNRWTSDTNNNVNAMLPRFASAGSINNSKNSDFWFVDGTYVRLKNATLSYTLPFNLTKKVGFKKINIFIAGTNLLTFSHLDKWDLDPEVPNSDNGWYYPQQRTISFGLSIVL